MKRTITIIAAVLLLAFTANAQLIGPLSGTIGPGDTLVTGDIWVDEGDSLTILPETNLLFNGYYEFDINGYLSAMGTEDDSIKFKPNTGIANWGGIDFNDSANDDSRLEYCSITGGLASGSYPDNCGGGIGCYSSSPTIENCSISGNSSESNGGGIYCYDNSNLIISYCTISGNASENRGGGIYCTDSSPIINHCTINNNSIGEAGGGGICCYRGNPSIYGCTINGNSVQCNGGGIYILFSSPTIDSCTINNNTANDGGGINCYGSPNPIIINCTIIGNSAEGNNSQGGGIYCGWNANPTINNCTISGNSTEGEGGGIATYDSSPTIENCTISGNTASWDGGGIRCDNFTIIFGCTISDNISGDSGGGICLGGTPTIENCTISGNSAPEGGGILCGNSNPTIVNTIVEGNTGYGGIYFHSSANASVTYSDFYNNENGNFVCDPPPDLGVITAVNANGDSCDAFFNILLNPLFVGGGDFHLTENSPCIDAGSPDSPPDPDSTIADMGAFYFHQNITVTVSLNPYNPPIVIPQTGGSFEFNIGINNNSVYTQFFDVWSEIALPGVGTVPIITASGLSLPAGSWQDRDREQNVPINAPGGTYTYYAYIGEYPWIVDHYDAFTFIKEGTDGGYLGSPSDWICTGEPFVGENIIVNTPDSYALHAPYPNPFNPETTLSFELPQSGNVSLIVYDIQGREVARLADGFQPAGIHRMIFDGSRLSSGVYFARLSAGDFQQIRKLLLVK